MQAFSIAPDLKTAFIVQADPTNFPNYICSIAQVKELENDQYQFVNLTQVPTLPALRNKSSIFGTISWDGKQAQFTPELRGNAARARAMLSDGAMLESHWGAYIEQPDIRLDGKKIELPVPHKDMDIGGYSNQISICDDMVAIHCNHMSKGAFLASYENGQFSSWSMHKGTCCLTPKGLCTLVDEQQMIVQASMPLDISLPAKPVAIDFD